jgi:hypothetical protein
MNTDQEWIRKAGIKEARKGRRHNEVTKSGRDTNFTNGHEFFNAEARRVGERIDLNQRIDSC